MKIYVTNEGKEDVLDIQPDGRSLMEFLLEAGYKIPALCGGIGQCLTCKVNIDNVFLDKITPLSGVEKERFLLLPEDEKGVRLACQIIPRGEKDEGLKLTIFNV